jgi:putative protease
MEKELGKVIHYFDKAMVAVIRLNDNLAVGDTVKFVYGDNEFTQTIDSMEVEHKKIQSGKSGEEVAIKVSEKTHEGARVYKIE